MTILHPVTRSAGRHRPSALRFRAPRAAELVRRLRVEHPPIRLSIATVLAANVAAGTHDIDDETVAVQLAAILPNLSADERRRRLELVVTISGALLTAHADKDSGAGPAGVGRYGLELQQALEAMFRHSRGASSGSQWNRAAV